MQKQAMASSKFLLLSLALLLIALSFIANFTSASLEEANALQKWKASLQIPNNSQIVSSWKPLPMNTSAPSSCPSWFGISCNADGNINRLNLSTSELKVELGNMKSLTDLELSENQLSGSIPSTLGDLRSLNTLYLFANQLSGLIPIELGNMKSLTDLELSSNQLNGSIPSSLKNLRSLQILSLRENKLSGPIPQGFRSLQLFKLQLDTNQLSGELPDDLCQGESFKIYLFGVYPSLNLLDVSHNKFHGQLSQNWGKCKKLATLKMGYNNISGSIPPEMGNSIQVLDLSSNHLVGQIPKEFGEMKSLLNLNLSDNNLSGVIPQEFASLNQLNVLDLSKNSQLNVLDLSCNSLTKEIPSEIGSLKSLKMMNLSHNKLSGSIPNGFSNLPKGIDIDLSYNELTGPVPPYVSGEALQGNDGLCGNFTGYGSVYEAELEPNNIVAVKKLHSSSENDDHIGFLNEKAGHEMIQGATIADMVVIIVALASEYQLSPEAITSLSVRNFLFRGL
ncbi:MDIS1-interacting receptor like kinase 2-like protein [Tanacetum coccineum]